MTMALDVVAFLERAMDDAKATNFAGLYYLVTGSVIAGAPRTIRKGPSLIRNAGRVARWYSGRCSERHCTHEDAHPSRRSHLCEHLR